MASVTVTVRSIRQVGGTVFVRWSDKSEQEFRGLAEARAYARDADFLRDAAKRLLIARYLRLDNAGSNPSLLEGHSLTLTDENNSMAVVT